MLVRYCLQGHRHRRRCARHLLLPLLLHPLLHLGVAVIHDNGGRNADIVPATTSSRQTHTHTTHMNASSAATCHVTCYHVYVQMLCMACYMYGDRHRSEEHT